MKNMLLLNEVAALLCRRPYQIAYAISNGHVDEPQLRIGNRRIFQPTDVRRLAEYFGIESFNNDRATVGAAL